MLLQTIGKTRVLFLFGALVVCAMLLTTFAGKPDGLVVYTSVDQRFSEPVFRAFEAKTGLPISAVYDVEAVKTTGLTNRLIAEGANPQADVFWSGEVLQMQRLRTNSILAPYHPPALPDDMRMGGAGQWIEFGGRARVLIVNTDRLGNRAAPASILDLGAEVWPGKEVALAYPLFGTTATHVAALDGLWGRTQTLAYFSNLDQRDARFVAGNSVVRDLVTSGQVIFGLTDTDDACGARARGAPVQVILPDQDTDGLGTLVIPNSVALIASSRTDRTAIRFVDFLIGDETQTMLARIGWTHIRGQTVVADPACGLPATLKTMPLTLSEDPARLLQALKALIVR